MGSIDAVKALIAASRADPQLDGPVFRRKEEIVTCLVVKDPSAPISAALLNSSATNTLFDEVIGVGKLRRRIAHGRKNQKTTKQAEEFGKTFSLIFVQPKVSEPLKETLGLGFYKRSRHLPVPLAISDTSFASTDAQRQLSLTVKAIVQSAQLILKPDSKLCSVRVGHTKMDAQKLADNVDALIKRCRQCVPNGLGGSATFYVKTADSLALKIE